MQDLESWLAELGLEKYSEVFAKAEIDFEVLPSLDKDDLIELGLPIGPRRKIMDAVSQIQRHGGGPANSAVDAKAIETTDSSPASPNDAERRHLTVMFVDLVGSTEIAERADPEDMRNVITNYQNTVAGVVGRHEGFVAKFMGDGVLNYFGWPRANEDDAERAVRAGLEIIDVVRKTKAPDGTALATRVGMATGVVIVGDLVGSGAAQEAAVVGETPNLAARLQSVARANQLVMPFETRRLLGRSFKVNSIGEQTLKGVGAPVEAFVAKGETAVESRFAARRSGILTPIVGREHEIELVLDRWKLARVGHGQMVVVSGEAGIGKSRITRAVVDSIAQDDQTRITYQCSPYHADSAFYPIIQQLTFATGIAPTDTPDERMDKLEALIDADHDTLRFVAPMLGLDGSGRYGALSLTPAQLRAQTMQALIRLLEQQASEKPVLLIYEDLHWIDPTSLELLDLILDSITDKPVMVLATTRPSFEHGFGGHPIVTRFSLNRLGNEQIGAIIGKLTDGKSMPSEIIEIIAQRTDGVPLFVEELTKTILESGALKEIKGELVADGPISAIAIPTTLHDSLMARLDRLQPIKDVAQTAACIGREFNHRLLADVCHLSEAELGAALDGLIAAELIYRRGLPPEATYIFKHALVRDAAYESLLKENRRAVHTRILAALETDPDIAPEVLATHAEAAGETDRAISLWESASKVAFAGPAFEEAVRHLRRAFALNGDMADAEELEGLKRALNLQVQIAPILLALHGYAADETTQAYQVALSLAEKLGDSPLRFPALYGLWVGNLMTGRHQEALKTARYVTSEAECSGVRVNKMTGHRLVGVSCCMLGNFFKAQAEFDLALSLYDPDENVGFENRFGQDPGVAIRAYQSLNLWCLGRTQESEYMAKTAEEAALKSDHANTVGYVHVHVGLRDLLDRADKSALRHASALRKISDKFGLKQMGVYAGSIEALTDGVGGGETWVEIYERFEKGYSRLNARLYLPIFKSLAAWKALRTNEISLCKTFADQARLVLSETQENFIKSDLLHLEGMIALKIGDHELAEECLKQAVEVASAQHAKKWELRAAISLSALWKRKGWIEQAITLLESVRKDVADGDSPDEVAAACKFLSEK